MRFGARRGQERLACAVPAIRIAPMKSLYAVFCIMALCAIGGCGSSPPALLNGSDQGVVVRYSQSSATSADAVAAADKFCSQYGRKAVQGDANLLTGDTYVSFSCQKP